MVVNLLIKLLVSVFVGFIVFVIAWGVGYTETLLSVKTELFYTYNFYRSVFAGVFGAIGSFVMIER